MQTKNGITLLNFLTKQLMLNVMLRISLLQK